MLLFLQFTYHSWHQYLNHSNDAQRQERGTWTQERAGLQHYIELIVHISEVLLNIWLLPELRFFHCIFFFLLFSCYTFTGSLFVLLWGSALKKNGIEDSITLTWIMLLQKAIKWKHNATVRPMSSINQTTTLISCVAVGKLVAACPSLVPVAVTDTSDRKWLGREKAYFTLP